MTIYKLMELYILLGFFTIGLFYLFSSRIMFNPEFFEYLLDKHTTLGVHFSERGVMIFMIFINLIFIVGTLAFPLEKLWTMGTKGIRGLKVHKEFREFVEFSN